MSEQTVQDIDRAVHAHAADVEPNPCMVGDWIVGYTVVDPESGATGYAYATSAGMAPHTLLGLLRLTEESITTDLIDDDSAAW